MAERKHKVSVVVEGQQIDGWSSYKIDTSMIDPSDTFTMRRPWSAQAWNTLRKDARIRVMIDDVAVLDGLIDKRRKSSKDDMLEVSGRDRAGRLFQESAPAINYEGLLLLDAVKKLASPWFTTIVSSDARNRSLRRGKGRRVSAGNEPVVVNIRVPRAGRVHPGMTKWAVIEEICSQAGYIVFGSADGRELVVGKPNYSQAAQFLVVHPKAGSPNKGTCKDLEIVEDIGDCYSLIAVVGAGGTSDVNYGANASSRRGVVLDGPNPDGTGNNFLYPKRLIMPERDFNSNDDANRVALREQRRRRLRSDTAMAMMPFHGQFIVASAPTIFTTDTIAYVLDEDFEPQLADDYLIYACSYECNENGEETTQLEMVPSGTEIVL